jgi:hypothetical protein
MRSDGSHCDFPEDCLSRYYPPVYDQLKTLWVVGAGLSWALVIVTAFTDAARSTRVRVAAVGVIMSGWFLSTPVLWFEGGFGFNSQPAYIDTLYKFGLLALLIATALIAWELIRRPRGTATPAVEEPRKAPTAY